MGGPIAPTPSRAAFLSFALSLCVHPVPHPVRHGQSLVPDKIWSAEVWIARLRALRTLNISCNEQTAAAKATLNNTEGVPCESRLRRLAGCTQMGPTRPDANQPDPTRPASLRLCFASVCSTLLSARPLRHGHTLLQKKRGMQRSDVRGRGA